MKEKHLYVFTNMEPKKKKDNKLVCKEVEEFVSEKYPGFEGKMQIYSTPDAMKNKKGVYKNK